MLQKAESIVMQLDGVHDAATQRAAAQVLKGLPGVRSASVNRREGAANVRFFPEQTSVAELTQALAQAGFPVI